MKKGYAFDDLFRRSWDLQYREVSFGVRPFPDIEKEARHNSYCKNSVTTAKYSLMSFMPRSLFEQFRRVANAYFLLISVLMLIGSYTSFFDSPLTPWSTLIPLVVVLLISIGKEGVEDLKRHYADRHVNNRKAHRLLLKKESMETFKDIPWQEISVGTILCIHNNEEIPADVVLLATSESSGSAYIETANIDGENNLKIKQSARTGTGDQCSAFSSPEQLRNVELTVKCEHPNSAIHNFMGTLFFGDREISVDASNLLLRGSSLRNTRWTLGLVVYAGRETKIVMNSRAAPSKLSSIERTMNNLIYLIFSTQVLISTISLISYVVWKNFNYDKLDYLCYNFSDSYNPIYRLDCIQEDEYNDIGYWFTFFILFNNFMPISLYVTVELCNYVQAFYVDNDIEMYDPVSDTPALSRTSNMNGDLGMVEFVFSDKTGTLTENVMRFKRCSVGGVVFGDSPSITGVPGDGNGDGDGTKSSSPGVGDGGEDQDHEDVLPSRMELRGAPLQRLLEDSLDTSRPAGTFVLALALCHTVVVEHETGALQSESPDEEALVKAAVDLGWAFRSRGNNKIVVESTRGGGGTSPLTPPPSKQFELLATIPFDSTRKRMSVVLRGEDGSVFVICKGADNIIFDRSVAYLGRGVNRDVLSTHLDLFASDGLRTLLIAMRSLSKEEYGAFSVAWQEATTALSNRVELTQRAAALIERNLTVIGATAIEDKLQQGVPETIADLGDAGVKVWVLTGDKVETAINIGYSSRLLGPHMVLIRLTDRGEDATNVKRRLKALVAHLSRITKNKALVHQIWENLQSTIKDTIYAPKVAPVVSTLSSSVISNPLTCNRDHAEIDHSHSGASVEPLVRQGQSHSHSHSQHGLDDLSLHNQQQHNHHHDRGTSTHSSSNNKKDAFMASLRLDQLTSDHLALIVDGDTLIKIFGDAQAERLLLTLATVCKAVIACRVSPEQKRLMVRLVKRGVHPRPITLSIGDGANDVAMIQEAQIGVGISGREGLQAVNSSDFAIAQFRFLKRLMLVHGRWDYRRISKVVIFSFYKNIVLTLVLFAFTFFSGYSGQSLFDDYIYSGYNFFLALPVVAFGVFDRDISAVSLERYKMLYVSGRERLDMNIPVLGKQLLLAVIDAIFTFFIPYLCYSASGGVWGQGMGEDSGMWILGTTVFTCLVISMFLRGAMLTCTWTSVSVAFMVGSVALYMVFLWVYQHIISSYNFYGVTENMMSESTFWLLCLLVPSFSIILEITSMTVQREFFPTLVDVGMEFDGGLGGGKRRGGDFLGGRPVNPLGACLTDDGRPPTTTGHERKESVLRFSSVVASGAGGRPKKFPLDWASIKELYGSLAPREKEGLGLESTAELAATAYNYDHVANEYGPGAGASYLLVRSISAAVDTARKSIFGIHTATIKTQPGIQMKNVVNRPSNADALSEL
eukprot:gene8259-16990_t